VHVHAVLFEAAQGAVIKCQLWLEGITDLSDFSEHTLAGSCSAATLPWDGVKLELRQ